MTSQSEIQHEVGDEPQIRVRGWLPAVTTALSVIGLLVAAYLTYTHYTEEPPLCSANAVVDCESVTTSPESSVFGIPVVLPGLAYFLFMLVVCLPMAWRPTNPLASLFRLGRLLGAAAGMISVVYLVSAEFFLIGKICLWCTSIHVIVVLLAVLLVGAALAGWGTVVTDDQSADAA